MFSWQPFAALELESELLGHVLGLKLTSELVNDHRLVRALIFTTKHDVTLRRLFLHNYELHDGV